MKTLWILAAAAMFAACAKSSDEEVGAAPDRGDTTAVTTQVDTATGQWDTTGATGDVNAQPGDTLSMPADTTVGQYPTPSDTGAYVPDPGAAGVDTTAVPTEPSMDPGTGTDSTLPADPGAPPPTDQAPPQ